MQKRLRYGDFEKEKLVDFAQILLDIFDKQY